MFLGILIVWLVTAGVVPFLSNSILGSSQVRAPIFYLDGPHEDGGAYHKLYVEEIPADEEVYFFDGHRVVFKTEDLDVDSFYSIKLKGIVWLKTNNSGSTIQARFIKLRNNNNEQTICDVSSPITINSDDFEKYEFSCLSDGEIDLSPYNRIGLELRGNGNETIDYQISVGKEYGEGYSRVEVIPQ